MCALFAIFDIQLTSPSLRSEGLMSGHVVSEQLSIFQHPVLGHQDVEEVLHDLGASTTTRGPFDLYYLDFSLCKTI